MINPMQLFKMFGGNQDPMKMINNMVQNNPQLGQYWNMAQQMTQGKTQKEIQEIANNLLKQRGMNMAQIEQMFQQFIGNSSKF